MRRLRYLLAGLSAMLVASIAVACSDASNATRPPIPPANFAENHDACIWWSCAWGDCGRDPAIYGACCMEQGAPGEGVPRPSCQITREPRCSQQYLLDDGMDGSWMDDSWYCTSSCCSGGDPTTTTDQTTGQQNPNPNCQPNGPCNHPPVPGP